MTTTLQVTEATFKEHGYEYSRWQVTGYVNGKRVRFRAKNKDHAQMILVREQTKGINSERSVEYLPTHLSKAQLDEAEAIIEKLGRRATLTEVFDFWHVHHAASGELITLSDAVTRYLNFQESRVRSNTWGQSKQALNKFAAYIGSDAPVCEITHQSVVRYLDSLRAADGVNAASNKYWNNVRIVLHAFFAWTTEKPQEFTGHNVVADIRSKQREDKEIQTLNADQCAKMMAHVDGLEGGKHARLFALALFAGVRPEGELKKLEERDIDLVNGVIKIRKEVSKVKQARQITIQPNLRSWLEKYADQPLSSISEHAYRKIKDGYAKGHDILRHTFCSNHLHISGSFAETAMEAGNSEKILRSNYVNRTTKAESGKFWAIKPEFVPEF
jgi:integrase